MGALLWPIPALPLAAFVILALFGRALRRAQVAVLGVGAVAIAAGLAIAVGAKFLAAPVGSTVDFKLWTWMQVGAFSVAPGFRLDALSLVMVLVVTVVGALILLYSAGFMAEDPGYARFFCYMNLFVGAMLILVLADNLVLLYLGWEGVGFCSYLLIGFWYADPANGRAARKAFIVTRVGDAALLIGLVFLAMQFGTLDIATLIEGARRHWVIGTAPAIAAASLLLAGAVGKSAQLPLQTWLPDAMAGPTPVSALIHAATMVTAGVYLIARTHPLFDLAPPVQEAVAAIGAVTLVLAAFAALAQNDIKRILAFSTMSQIGYMFLALGVGAWGAAIFHLVTHAFFKALLFLAAGAVIGALDDEHDIRRMGGLWLRAPTAFWSFLVGACALSALPLVTAGAYSKDLILAEALRAPDGGPALWAAGAFGAALTGVYTFRVVFRVFFGPVRTAPTGRPGLLMRVPLLCLSVLSILGGILPVPSFLAPTLGLLPAGETWWLSTIAGALSVGGIAAAWLLFRPGGTLAARLGATQAGAAVLRLWRAGWGFDLAYDRVFVRPVLAFAQANRADGIDRLFEGIGWIGRVAHRGLSATQTGRVRDYASGLAAGAALALAIAVFLA